MLQGHRHNPSGIASTKAGPVLHVEAGIFPLHAHWGVKHYACKETENYDLERKGVMQVLSVWMRDEKLHINAQQLSNVLLYMHLLCISKSSTSSMSFTGSSSSSSNASFGLVDPVRSRQIQVLPLVVPSARPYQGRALASLTAEKYETSPSICLMC